MSERKQLYRLIGTFLSEFILQDIDWIKWYAKYIQETQESYSVNDKEYRLDTCWQQENFLNIFDLYFEELLSEISGVQFLKHKKRIKDEIAKWKAIRNNEKVEEILIKMYQ